MRRILLSLFTAVLAPLLRARPTVRGLDVAVLADAIAAVESGGDAKRIGALGERGRCQFREYTWREYTPAPFLLWAPVDCEFTRGVERARIRHLCEQLKRLGHEHPFPSLIAAAWRYGTGNAQRCLASDYARRVSNLYWDEIERREGPTWIHPK